MSPKAPELVDGGLVHRREDAFEGLPVGVDIAYHRYAQAGSVPPAASVLTIGR